MRAIIHFDHVSFDYGQTPVLKDLSLRVFAGEFVHVIGPNGGGKTTLLKLLMGFLEPCAGTLHINGKPPKQMQHQIAYVPQVFAFDKLFPISVLEVVLAGRLSRLPWHGRYSRSDHQKAMQALRQVGMQDFHHYAIGELSGGQVQRVLIARALVSDPQILLLDEPTSCIDHGAQLAIDKILKNLKGKLTIIMVTHDLDHMGKNADRIFCIHGKLSELQASEVCQHFAMGLYPENEEALV